MRDKFLVFGKPRIEEDEIAAVSELMRTGWIGTGKKVKEFEDKFKEHIGTKYAMALNSCTAGLHLAMIVLGLQPGDEVITTPMTFCATANTIIHAGGKPVFVDIEKDTLNIDPKQIEKAITSKTKAIVPVHFAGRPCNMDAIMAIAKKYNLKVVEDCAHSIEAEYHGQKTGSIGDIGCFSFYVTKNIITGEGGMVTTNNEEYADKVKMYGLHGMSRDAWKRFSDEGFKHYDVIFPGFKYNMMDMQAVIGVKQLEKIDKYYQLRQKIWSEYNNKLKDLPLILPAAIEPNTKHALHLYTVLLDLDKVKISRDDLLNGLVKQNIGTGVHYRAVHLHPYYQKTYGYKRGDFPNAEFVSDRTLSIPISAQLELEEGNAVNDVVEALRKVLGK